MEVEDIGSDDQRYGESGEHERRDRKLPLGTRLDVGIQRRGIQSGDTGEEVAAEAVAAGGAGGILAIGSDLSIESAS